MLIPARKTPGSLGVILVSKGTAFVSETITLAFLTFIKPSPGPRSPLGETLTTNKSLNSSPLKESVFPTNVRKRLAVEAGCSTNWYRYIGLDGKVISIDTFGASAPAALVFESFGFNTKNVVEKVKEML